jgi:hypothetical protein
MEFKSYDIKIFINTLCHDNVDDHEFLNCNMFFHWKYI